ncbi:GNAT family N-acetyltransferase [Euzebya tangerina]|uniref:GNAT family N-acetyltransferase n=1 Tax=Euzebya tangerina TaxID=591198 RepID=UPI000E311707|nr:GNAT family N-acetyltransferase [Euzebya tangerina]
MTGPWALRPTERLDFRPWRPDEASVLLDIRSRPEVARWLADPNPWTSLDQAAARIKRWTEVCASDDPFGVWAIVVQETGEVVGTVDLHTGPITEGPEIGWYLHPGAVGRGYATEAAGRVLAHGRAHQVGTIWAVMLPDNDASAQVASRIGMWDLGVLEDPWYGTPEEPLSRMFRDPPPPD